MNPIITSAEMNPEQVARVQHIEWRNQPTTVQMVRNLNHLKSKFTTSGIQSCADMSVNPEQFRLYFSNIKTIDTVLAIINNTETFLETAKQQQNQISK